MMNRRKILRKYALFYTYGQYMGEKSIFGLIGTYIWIAAIGVGALYYLYTKTANGTLDGSAAIIVPACIHLLIGIFDNGEESDTGYNLTDRFAITCKEVLRIRMMCRAINAGEILYLISFAVFLSVVFTPAFGVPAAILLIAACVIIEEIAAYAFYRARHKWGFIICLGLLFLAPVAWELSPLLASEYGIPIGRVLILRRGVCVSMIALPAGIMLIRSITAAAKRNTVRRVHEGPRNARDAEDGNGSCGKDVKVRGTGRSVRGQLFFKEVLFIRQMGLLMLFTPLLYVAFLLLSKDTDKTVPALPCFAVITLIAHIGLDAFGIEKHTFVPILLSPVPRIEIVRAKSKAILILVAVMALVAFAGGMVKGVITTDGIVYYSAMILFYTGISLPLAIFCSIRFCFVPGGEDRKKNSILGKLFFATGAVIAMAAGFAAYSHDVDNIVLFSIGLAVFIAGVFVTVIRPGLFGKYLEKNEKAVLRRLAG